MHIIDTYNI